MLAHQAECCHLVVVSTLSGLTDCTCGSWTAGRLGSTGYPVVCPAPQPPGNRGQMGRKRVCSMPEFPVHLLGNWVKIDRVHFLIAHKWFLCCKLSTCSKLSWSRHGGNREKGRWLENAHLQPAAALPVTKLPKSPEAASRTCREKNVLLNSKTNTSENKPEIFIKDS